MPEPNTGCWLWLGEITQNGYSRLKVKDKNIAAHRIAYELFKGPIPEGLVIDHLCRNRCCVNPQHLEAVTQQVNTLRGVSLQSQNAKKVFCVNGHPFSSENTTVNAKGRTCKACQREYTRKYRAKKEGCPIEQQEPQLI